MDGCFLLRIERDCGHRRPVACAPAPACRRLSACLLIKVVAGAENRMVGAGMTLSRGDVADRAVPVLVIVPVHEAGGPVAGGVKIGEAPLWEFGAVLSGAKQGLHVWIVVADT